MTTQVLEHKKLLYKTGRGGKTDLIYTEAKAFCSYLITFIYFNTTIFVIIHLLMDHAESF